MLQLCFRVTTPVPSLPCSPVLASAGQWFLRSGIQDAQGGVARYHRFDSGNLPVSTEITGYAISALSWLFRMTGEPQYLAAAEQNAKFLLEKAWHPEYGLFPFELDYPLPDSYFFDCGIIIRGLLALWRINNNQLLLDVATACAYGMRQFRATDGRWSPILALPHFEHAAYQKKWSKQPGCFQLKSALAWAEVAALTNDDVLQNWFDRALAQALANDSSFLPGSGDSSEVMNRLHAYCYYLEALLAAPEHVATLTAGIEKAYALLIEIAPNFERSDVCAQLLRLSLLANHGEPSRSKAAAERLATYQFKGGETAIAGGFGFGRRDGVMLPMVNPVSTAFAMQALAMFELHSAGKFPGSVADLI